jgi:type 1 glutamine amidotransferase
MMNGNWNYPTHVRFGAGRVVYDGFGHDAASINDPHHAALIRAAARWCAKETR